MERQHTEWEKIFANDVTDKRLISKIYQKENTAQYQKYKQPNQKMGRGSRYTFFQRRHTDGPQAHEKMFNIANY